MDPEQQGGGRLMGMPIWVWLIGAAVVVYFVYKHFAATSASGTSGTGAGVATSGGGGQASDRTVIKRGAVHIVVENHQPKPPTWSKKKRHEEHPDNTQGSPRSTDQAPAGDSNQFSGTNVTPSSDETVS